MKSQVKGVQYFSDEYLESCKKMTPTQICRFLEDYQKMMAQQSGDKTVLISLRVPSRVLAAFKAKAQASGKKYQTQLVQLISDCVK